jgi:hypothetical protein
LKAFDLAPGTPVLVYLHSPRERVFGLLLSLQAAGVALRGIDLASLEDWIRQETRGDSPGLGLVTVFYPMSRVERVERDETVGELESEERHGEEDVAVVADRAPVAGIGGPSRPVAGPVSRRPEGRAAPRRPRGALTVGAIEARQVVGGVSGERRRSEVRLPRPVEGSQVVRVLEHAEGAPRAGGLLVPGLVRR